MMRALLVAAVLAGCTEQDRRRQEDFDALQKDVVSAPQSKCRAVGRSYHGAVLRCEFDDAVCYVMKNGISCRHD